MKLILMALAFVLGACGGGEESWCPGTVCSNCASDPACSVSCPAGKQAACVGGSFFDADPNLRCGYCK